MEQGSLTLTVQAHSEFLKPPKRIPTTPNIPCQKVHGAKATMLFLSLYLVALGVGGIKGALPAHGAEQFDENTPQGRKQRSTFFNYFVFCLSCGALIAVTLVVLISALLNAFMPRSSSNFVVSMVTSPSPIPDSKEVAAMENGRVLRAIFEAPSESLKFLNRAVLDKPISETFKCSVQQVEEVKGITHLQRIGIGLVLSIVAMAIAALVEIKQKKVAIESKLLDSTKQLPVTFFYIAFQYLFLGSADLFTLAGLLKFFFAEAPFNMRSLATSLSSASLAMGYYLSTAIVSLVNSLTDDSKHKPWLSGANLNQYHLERFYWLLCALSGLNLMHYLFWARIYEYRSKGRGNV
ncbi:NRT1 PTR FAMILY [Olea europaea subsp. europaea]|uniref:NRT1 PTR FAMILY n=1 Tax=Olea europaea subsp. europaea TaxID=158383 RepID=A0A8S0RM55_OLEEU|nr:NRT1 PTR FAMILY [Olea europaea subsp. europaea]